MTNYPKVNNFEIGFQPMCFSNSLSVIVSEPSLLKPVILPSCRGVHLSPKTLEAHKNK